MWTTLSSQSGTGGVLGTLNALAGTAGSVSTGWRAAQGNNDDTYLMQNGYMSNASGAALTFARDDVNKASLACTKEISGPYFRWLYTAAAAGAITWTELARLTSAGALQPGSDGSGSLGTSSVRWTSAYLSAAATIGSIPAATGLVRLPNNGGGIAWRNAANSADLVLDASGTNALTFRGNVLALSNRISLAQTGTATTLSTSTVSSGLGTGAITPAVTAALKIVGTWFASNNTSGDGVRCFLYRTTGNVPSNGASVAVDTLVWSGDQNVEVGTNGGFNFPYAAAFLDTGVSVGTAYKYYLAYEAITGGTAQVDSLSMVVEE